jgi:hypothetical protein
MLLGTLFVVTLIVRRLEEPALFRDVVISRPAVIAKQEPVRIPEPVHAG